MSTWTLAYDAFVPEEEGLREALTSTGNGYFCTRGTCEWADSIIDRLDDPGCYYPGTYMHGGFNRTTTMMGGRPVVNEDFVNLPNWLPMTLRIEGGEPFSLGTAEVLSYHHEFDIRHCTVNRTVRFKDGAGRETTLFSRRFVSMAKKHLAALEWTITAENWSGKVEVISALEGRVHNWGVARYRELESRQLEPVSTGVVGDDGMSLLVRTNQSSIYIAEAARTRVFKGGEAMAVARGTQQQDGNITQTLAFDIAEGEPVVVEKLLAFYTSRDSAISKPLVNAETTVARLEGFEAMYAEHWTAWDHLWGACDIELPKQDRVQMIIRFHINHILQCCSPNTVDLDAGVPARGLNGESYRGHIFWDELYIYPFITSRIPEITRSLLMYRYRRIDEARALAKAAGYRGAMYPWQSGSDGSEETQVVHLNPKSGSWDPDFSHNQRHVNAAIFYNIWQYFETTGDTEFLAGYGAEMLLEIARFWASIAHFNAERDRYEIHGVMGPDEFHESVYGSDKHGVPNNAYTNMMVAWIMEVAQKVLDALPPSRRTSLRETLGIDDAEVRSWSDMCHKMFVPFHGDGLLTQFEGYENLEELDWDAYRAKYDNIHRMDRILKAEGTTPDKYKVAKQADTLMLWYLFPEEQLRRLFTGLGYEYKDDTARKNTDYYYERCSHGSTLSLIVHAAIERELEPSASWDMFLSALESDVNDIQGGTTKEGIHMGVMAGTLDLVQRGYMGAEVRDGALYFDPKLTDHLDGVSYAIRFLGAPLRVSLQSGQLTVKVEGEGHAVSVGVGDSVREIGPGESTTFAL
ncbi:MAG: glycoside hydrolase family 65 protein [Rhodospirillales bacterium]|nr:glycoside hydrolase family 65 protein [Rhodospirillales bacterium]